MQQTYTDFVTFQFYFSTIITGEVHATHSEHDISILYKYDYNVNTRHHAGCG